MQTLTNHSRDTLVFTASKRSLGQDSVFTPVCLSVNLWGGGRFQWVGVSQHAMGKGCVSQHAMDRGCVSQHAMGRGCVSQYAMEQRVVCLWVHGGCTRPLGRHPQADIPWTYLPLADTHLLGRPPPRRRQWMHSTGMHSCLICNYLISILWSFFLQHFGIAITKDKPNEC